MESLKIEFDISKKELKIKKQEVETLTKKAEALEKWISESENSENTTKESISK